MEADDRSEPADIGAPRDYSESVYPFYLEVADCSPTTRRLIEDFLP